MTSAASAFRDRTTEAVCFLLMDAERGNDVSRLADALNVSPARMHELMDRGRAGELPRVPPVGGSVSGAAPVPRYAFAVGSKTASIADAFARLGEMSRLQLAEQAKRMGATLSEARSRLRTGFVRADVPVELMPDGGLRVPQSSRARLRALSDAAWNIMGEV
ncbi:MAG: hypothetical protein KKB37_11250 [Alphaproteobacteria bacterium]|nr:hypothetical protein [Alphaproteobacteria bacterium]